MTMFDTLTSRYVLKCTLKSEAGLHIGTGISSPTTDAPFIRQAGSVFLPGSSLRGALRSTVERMTKTLAPGKNLCALFSDSAKGCMTASTSEEQEAALKAGTLHFCEFCQFFGSTGIASRLKISDALQTSAAPKEPVRRDGVGIDRDTETASDGIKYDFEVLERLVEFSFTIQLENATSTDFALLYLMLKEMEFGFEVGGKRSRGLGRLRLEKYEVSFFDNSADPVYGLRQFLEAGQLKTMTPGDFEAGILKPKFTAYFVEEAA